MSELCHNDSRRKLIWRPVNKLHCQTSLGAHLLIESSDGKAAASEAAQCNARNALPPGTCPIIVATGNSQTDFIKALATEENLDWGFVEVFHMDEYVGMSSSHPASFAHWLKARFTDVVHPGKVHYLRGDSPDLAEEMHRYDALLSSGTIDLCFLGIGENGHIAFNDPHVANFHDPLVVKRVALDNKCRLQQVGEGHFPTWKRFLKKPLLSPANPNECQEPHLLRPRTAKGGSCAQRIQGPLSQRCPASLVATHPRATIYLDTESATFLNSLPVSQ